MKFFIVSPWRNKDAVNALTVALAVQGHHANSFLNCGANLASGKSVNDEFKAFENALVGWQNDPLVENIFSYELAGLKEADALILLEPSGHSSLAEAGIAYGMGKPVILVGLVERPEIVYRICAYRYPSVDAFLAALDEIAQRAGAGQALR